MKKEVMAIYDLEMFLKYRTEKSVVLKLILVVL